MNNYATLWEYISSCKESNITLTFKRISEITGSHLDHSFLRYKKELAEYGYTVKKFLIKEQKVTFEKCRRNL